MPTPEQPQQQPEDRPAEALEGMPKIGTTELHEQRYKTIAVRVEERLHTQLQFISDLAGTSLSEEVRAAIESRIVSAQDDPMLIERAREVRQEIEREAAARTAAIAGFMGHTATAGAAEKPKTTARGRSNTKRGE